MSRSLAEIQAREQEVRKALRDLRLSINNKRASLTKDEADEAKLMAEVDTLEAEALDAFRRTREVGQGEIVPDAPVPNVFDAGLDALNSAFDRATTPQDGLPNGVAF